MSGSGRRSARGSRWRSPRPSRRGGALPLPLPPPPLEALADAEAQGEAVAGSVPEAAPEREPEGAPLGAEEALAEALRAPLPLGAEGVGATLRLRVPHVEGDAPRDSRGDSVSAPVGRDAAEGGGDLDRAGVLDRVALPRGVPLAAPLPLPEGGGERDASAEDEADAEREGKGVNVTA